MSIDKGNLEFRKPIEILCEQISDLQGRVLKQKVMQMIGYAMELQESDSFCQCNWKSNNPIGWNYCPSCGGRLKK